MLNKKLFSAALCSLLVAGLAQAAPQAKRADVETLPSGVRIEHTVKGGGVSPSPISSVTVHYVGTFKDGSIFDSSYARRQPATFPLNRVVPCWTQAITHLQVGGSARIYCPSDTAYGARGAGSVIPPNTDLIFDVQLLDVKEP